MNESNNTSPFPSYCCSGPEYSEPGATSFFVCVFAHPSPAGPHRHAHVTPCCYPHLYIVTLPVNRRSTSHAAPPGHTAPAGTPTTRKSSWMLWGGLGQHPIESTRPTGPMPGWYTGPRKPREYEAWPWARLCTGHCEPADGVKLTITRTHATRATPLFAQANCDPRDHHIVVYMLPAHRPHMRTPHPVSTHPALTPPPWPLPRRGGTLTLNLTRLEEATL